MPTVSYPLDRTGLSTANKVPDEVHVLTEVNDATYRILIPDFAPFYLDNFSLVHVDTLGVHTTLDRDLDYIPTIPYLSASTAIGKMLYGGVSISNKLVNGSILVSYQTLGGDDNANVNFVREQLYEITINPRTTSWEIIANKPDIFPPYPHDHTFDDVAGSDDLVKAVNDISNAIAAGPNPSNSYVSHLVNEDNPHNTTKAQLDLDKVANIATATDAEVAAHQRLEKHVTLKQIISLLESLGIAVP